MTDEEMRAASELLRELCATGQRIDELPIGPANRAEAYRLQQLSEDWSCRPLFGWKIAATSAAGQSHIGVGGPLAGRLFAERVLADGRACPLTHNHMRVAELEFAFELGAELPARQERYATEEILGSVKDLRPAIEIPDSRFEHFEKVGELALIADNACANLLLLGEPCTLDWRNIDLAAHRVTGSTNGQPTHQGAGSNVLGDPRLALSWLVNELTSQGISLRTRQIIITGTCVTPMPIREGDCITGDFGRLGRATLHIC